MVRALGERDHFLILTHRRPDGDTIGSAAALAHILRGLGKRAWVAPNEDLTPRYAAFVAAFYPPPEAVFDTIIAVDIADEGLFCGSMEGYKGRVELCIDHHPSNRLYAGQTWLEPKASATGEMIFSLAEALGARLTVPMLTAVYLALLTDTGCFLYSNTTPLAHRIAAQCIEAGVDYHGLNTEFYRKKTRARFLVERAMFASLRFSRDGTVAGATLTRADIDSAGATEDDLDNLASQIIALEGVACAVLATELKSGESKISVRTAAPLDASALCAPFGGGGHARAGGCTLDAGPPLALARVTAGAEAAWDETSHV
jgi:phosphoesterase RecJ-like protein